MELKIRIAQALYFVAVFRNFGPDISVLRILISGLLVETRICLELLNFC
ncbi:MAG: hypothetical protein ACJAU6_001463 [Alphaproteobacteria bacterium]|jgi:hypothetical protein